MGIFTRHISFRVDISGILEHEIFSLGQFICGEKRCDEKEHLRSWEVLFGYVEHGKKRDALVKLSK